MPFFSFNNHVVGKPKYRGFSHLVTFFVSILAGAWLIYEGINYEHTFVVSVFAVSVVLLYGISGLYHWVNWPDHVRKVLKRIDHATIFLLIAGTYTPILWIGLERYLAIKMLTIVWAIGLVGIICKSFNIKMPRFVSVGLYLLMGWISVMIISDIVSSYNLSIVSLILAGGILYSVGAVIYGLKKPNPIPSVFGYHEVFHIFVICGSVSHYFAIALINRQF